MLLEISDKTKAVLLLIVCILFSIIIPHFSIVVAVIVGYLFFKAKEPEYIDVFNETSITRQEKFHLFMKQKKDYLNSSIWSTKRARALERDHYQCVKCGSTTKLNVHHKRGYDQIPNESIDCLVTLCKPCHTYQHEQLGYPSTLEEYMNWNVELV